MNVNTKKPATISIAGFPYPIRAKLVGPAGVEPTTNGLKVGLSAYLPLLISVAKIYINQQLTEYFTVVTTSQMLTDIRQNSAKVATQWLRRFRPPWHDPAKTQR
jgi:hypothetical protein